MDVDYIPEDDDKEETRVSSQEAQFIGPDWKFEMYLTFLSPFVWLGILSLVGPFILGFIDVPLINRLEASVPSWGFVALGAGLILIGVISAHLLYINTSYIVKDKKLFISGGVVNKKVNTVPLRFVFDCDISASANEQIFGVQTLTLRATDEGRRNSTLKLRFITDGEACRDLILKDSAANDARVISSL